MIKKKIMFPSFNSDKKVGQSPLNNETCVTRKRLKLKDYNFDNKTYYTVLTKLLGDMIP